MKYLIVGDLHGKKNIVETILSSKYDEYYKVFVGDYVDSFTVSVNDQIDTLRYVITAVKVRDDVTGLIGNHELSYLRDGMRCSGFNPATAAHMLHLKSDIYKYLKNYMYLSDDILVTHAGASSNMFDDKVDVKYALEHDQNRLYAIGYARGGGSPFGGIFWNDFWKEHRSIRGLTQICGHTAYNPEGSAGIVSMDFDYNVDCLDKVPEVLLVDTEEDCDKRFTILNLESGVKEVP